MSVPSTANMLADTVTVSVMLHPTSRSVGHTSRPQVIPSKPEDELEDPLVHGSLEGRTITCPEMVFRPVPKHRLFVVQEEASVFDRRFAMLHDRVTREGDSVVFSDWNVGPPVPRREAHVLGKGIEAEDDTAL